MSAVKGLTPHALMSHMEKLCPGFKLIAGPFATAAPDKGTAKLEQRMCLNALGDQRRAGVTAKVVVCQGQAFVMRSAVGWSVWQQDFAGEIRGLALDDEGGLES